MATGGREEGTAREVAVRELRDSILNGRRVPGDRIVQEQVAKELGLSRVPVRESLRTLEAEGLVVQDPSGGFFVAKIDVDDLDSIHRVRQLLEAEAVRQAGSAGRIDAALSERMRTVNEKLHAAPAEDAALVGSLTRELHFTLLSACEDGVIMRILTNLWNASDSWRTVYYRLIYATDADHRTAVLADQDRLVELTAAGDVEAIVELIDRTRARGISMAEAAIQTNLNEPQWQAQRFARSLLS